MQRQEELMATLHKLAAYPRVGLISDMDGTLSPIVKNPADSAVTARNRELLQALHRELALVAIVSGRGAADLRRQVGLPELVYVGNHGLEQMDGDKVVAVPEAAAYRPALETAKAAVESQQVPGMWLEDKGVTLSVHYRNAPNPMGVKARYQPIMEQIAGENGLRFFMGRMIFELRPPIEIDKVSTGSRRLPGR